MGYTHHLRTKLGRLAFERGGVLALAALVVYVALAPTTIVDGDNAEFSTLGALGGRAHPSGYPLYVLYLRLNSWLPGSSPAHTAGIATAALAALLVFVLHAACRAWGARPIAATIACGMFAASAIVLRMHTEAEVFAMNGLAVACVLWLAAANGPVAGVQRGALLGLVAGLALSNHLTCALLAPVGILGVVRAAREARGRRAVAVIAAIGALALGLVPYAYLAVADSAASYGRVDGIEDVLAFVLRDDYGGWAAFSPTADRVSPLTSEWALASNVGRAWLWLPAIAVVGLAFVRFVATVAVCALRLGRRWLWIPAIALLALLGWLITQLDRRENRWEWAKLAAKRAEGDEPQVGWVMLAICVVVAGPGLALRFNVAPVELGLYLLQRFYLLPILLLAIPVAVGLDRAWSFVERDVGLDKLRRPAVANAIVLVGWFALVATALPRLRAVHSPAMERAVRNILASLPPRAVAIVSGDDLCFGATYLQYALGVRPDVAVVCFGLTNRPWYLAELRARDVPLFEDSTSTAMAMAIFPTGRPVFLNSQKQVMAGASQLASYPHGALVRVLPPGTRPPPVAEVLALNQRLFKQFDLDYPTPGSDDDHATVTHMRYSTTWIMLSLALKHEGKATEAQHALEVARQLYPPRFE